MSLTICPQCGKLISFNSYFRNYYCPHCGYMPEGHNSNTTEKEDNDR